jgi:hypothetical protein
VTQSLTLVAAVSMEGTAGERKATKQLSADTGAPGAAPRATRARSGTATARYPTTPVGTSSAGSAPTVTAAGTPTSALAPTLARARKHSPCSLAATLCLSQRHPPRLQTLPPAPPARTPLLLAPCSALACHTSKSRSRSIR